jgi:superfamily II DNA or RNA helicase
MPAHHYKPAAFLAPEFLIAGGPQRFVTHIERLLWHTGFADVRNIDGSGDRGGDILGLRNRERWVIQCKWRRAGRDGSVGPDAVEEAEAAARHYRCERAMLVTNARIPQQAMQRVDRLRRRGARIDVIDAGALTRIAAELPLGILNQFGLRGYQRTAADEVTGALDARRRALLILATGMGKTVVGGEVIRRHLARSPLTPILVVAHMKDLVAQLEKAMWPHLDRTIATHLLTGDVKPVHLDGVVFATVESALNAVREGYVPDVVMVDETHHVADGGHFAELLDTLEGARQFGVTATPWRGDRYDIEQRFGRAVFKLGIAEGMRRGYLAQVDYRLFVDNVIWDAVPQLSAHEYTVKELNRKLFLPQRDEAIATELIRAWNATSAPRAIVFCATIDHAERLTRLLRTTTPAWRSATVLHSGIPRRDRDVALAEFRRGDVPVVCAVDVLNEGVDVPDVNIVAFARVTHSRRIFIQQLGRGLRLRPGKNRVTVLDFVTDIRRVAALQALRAEIGPTEELKVGARITFNDARVESLMTEWIKDAASLETANDEARLNFPDPFAPVNH